MPFHSNNGSLPSIGSSMAARQLQQDLERARKSGAPGKAAEAMAWNKYNRSVAADSRQMENMSAGGNGRGSVRGSGPWGNSDSGSYSTIPSNSSNGIGMVTLAFYGGVAWCIWTALGKVHMQKPVVGIANGLWHMLVMAFPYVVKLMFFCANVLDLIAHHFLGH